MASNHLDARVYVGTYAKYNDGSLKGDWLDFADYGSFDDFMEACRELHDDEKDPEFMFQDWDGVPDRWTSEGRLDEETFGKIQDYLKLDDWERDAYQAYLDCGSFDDDSIDAFHEAYAGQADTDAYWSLQLFQDLGVDGIGKENLQQYFDYEAFGRDLMANDFHMGDEDAMDSEGEPEDPDHYYDADGYDQGEYHSDEEVGEEFVDSVYGGAEKMDKDTLESYFDHDRFGRDLRMTDYVEYDGYWFYN